MPAVKRSSPSVDIMPNVVRVLKLILMGTKSKKRNGNKILDIYPQIAAKTCQPHIARTIGKQCVGLANSALCGHRYTEAAKLLYVLCQDRSVFDMFVYRASMIVLENLELDNQDDIIHKFLRDIQHLELLNKKEIQLEYLIYGLTHRCYDIKENLKILIDGKLKTYLRKNPLLDPIFECYIMFLEWVELCDQLSQGESVGRDKMKSIVEDSILKLYNLIDNPGVWDVFVLKLVEVLEKCGEEDKIYPLLSEYVEKHPDNLNAHIYISLHLWETNPNSEFLIPHLEKISEMSPSDERVLILLEKLEMLEVKLEKCFMFLDYPSNGKNPKAWSILLDFLYEAKSSENNEALETINTCWTSRQETWHWLYFNPFQVRRLEETELVACKVRALLYLDKNHEFIKEVLEKFPNMQVIT